MIFRFDVPVVFTYIVEGFIGLYLISLEYAKMQTYNFVVTVVFSIIGTNIPVHSHMMCNLAIIGPQPVLTIVHVYGNQFLRD